MVTGAVVSEWVLLKLIGYFILLYSINDNLQILELNYTYCNSLKMYMHVLTDRKPVEKNITYFYSIHQNGMYHVDTSMEIFLDPKN